MRITAQSEIDVTANAFGDELPPGTKLCHDQYMIERYLASGGFGITYLARDSLGRKLVIKECFPGAMCCRHDRTTVALRSRGNEPEYEKIVELFEKEARALAELSHPYIVGVHQIFHDNGTAYMALDFVPGRDLLQIIEEEPNRFDPEDVKHLLIKVLDAVAYMHDHDILHRDISPDNILIEKDNTPVLIDFGAARESASRVSRVLSKILTVKDGYSPQEFYLAGSEQQYSSDLYALAATFYHLVSGTAPPSSHLRLAAAAKQAPDPLEPLSPTLPGYESYFIEAINRCLSIFPGERIQSAQEWRDLIDSDRRRRVLMEKAKEDREMEQRVARLVREYEMDRQRDRQEGADAKPKPLRPPPEPPVLRRRMQRSDASRWDILREPVADETGAEPAEETGQSAPETRRVAPRKPPRPVASGDPLAKPVRRDPAFRRLLGGKLPFGKSRTEGEPDPSEEVAE